MKTRAPSWMNWVLASAPRPDEPPVMKTILFSKRGPGMMGWDTDAVVVLIGEGVWLISGRVNVAYLDKDDIEEWPARFEIHAVFTCQGSRSVYFEGQ